jgi:hypothetical protein
MSTDKATTYQVASAVAEFVAMVVGIPRTSASFSAAPGGASLATINLANGQRFYLSITEDDEE